MRLGDIRRGEVGPEGQGLHTQLSGAIGHSQEGQDRVRKSQTRCRRGKESETPASLSWMSRGQLVSLSEKQHTGDKPTWTGGCATSGVQVEMPWWVGGERVLQSGNGSC